MDSVKILTPVVLIIFNRPELTGRIFETIREARPKKLFVIADGPRFPQETMKCQETRKIIDAIDWDCEVKKNYSETNLGCGRRIASGLTWVFSQVGEAIILEDDCLPAPSFFYFCEILLEFYRDNEKIMHIGGNNFQGGRNRTNYSYYFSKYPHIWGWATWSRAWKYYDFHMKTWPDYKKSKIICSAYNSPIEKKYWEDVFDRIYKGQIDTWDYQWTYNCWFHKGLSISPNVNLVSNIGFGLNATHTIGKNSRAAYLPTSDIWDIKHPTDIVRAQKADIYTFNHHFLTQKSDSLLLRIIRKMSKIIETVQDKRLQKRVENLKALKKDTYNTKPKISFIIQFFNKKKNIKPLLARLRAVNAEEIIVIDDGSIDGSYKEWPKYLTKPNDFLIRCNDLFEVRTYDRAIALARGEYVCLLQDDDLPPINDDWVRQAVMFFEIFPQLLVLGGRQGIDMLMPDPLKANEQAIWQRVGDIGSRAGSSKYRIYDTPSYKEPASNIPFMFVGAINRGPAFLRRREFIEIGGINQNFAPVQCDDIEVSTRAWLKGYRVGFYIAPFERNVATGGMRIFGNKEISIRQDIINSKKIYDSYGAQIISGCLQELIDKANSSLIKIEEK